jgi:hypothetical protein
MNERETDAEREALRAAQSELDRSNKRRTEIKVWVVVMGATFARVCRLVSRYAVSVSPRGDTENRGVPAS